MPSESTKRRCKQIRLQASEYLNFWLCRGLPLFALWAAIVYTSAVILHSYHVLPDSASQMITSLTISPFLVLLLLHSWSRLTQDRLQVLGTEPQLIQSRAWKFLASIIWMWRHRISLIILVYSVFVIAIDLIVAQDFVLHQVTLGLTTTTALMRNPSTTPLGLVTPISFILFILSLLAVLIMVVSTRKWSEETYEAISDARRLPPYITQAVCILPEKGRVGNTRPLLLDFDFSENYKSPCEDPAAKHLEVELQAAGLKVDGERRVKLCPSSSLSSSIWSCCLSSTGEHEISLIVRVVSPQTELSQETKDVIFHVEHTIHVKGLLSASWGPLLTITLAALSTVAAFVQALAH
jgi:hypothetical protein